jgi:aryl carrier-like protein
VLASNVLHATHDVRVSLRNVKRLLRSGGLLLLNEVAAKYLFAHIVFGLLDGWWRPADPEVRLRGSPVVAPDTWRRLLEEEGFYRIEFPAAPSHVYGQQIIAAMTKADASAAVPEPRRPGVRQDLRPAVPQELLRERACTKLAGIVARTLKLDPAEIDVRQPLDRYGVDSILAMRVVKALRADFANLASTALFEHRSISALVDHLVSVRPGDIELFVGVTPAPEPIVQPAPPNQLSVPYLRRTPSDTPQALEPMAVIGIAGRFPKARDIGSFWENLKQGRDCISEIPEDRWPLHGFYDGNVERALAAGRS